MSDLLPTELHLSGQPGSTAAVERLCDAGARGGVASTVAVSVAPSNVLRARDLLFGTGIGVVGSLDSPAAAELMNQARLSVASGASEIALPPLALDDLAILAQLKSYLGSELPITLDVTGASGALDLAQAERALLMGADYVLFHPPPQTAGVPNQVANLVALAGELQFGGVKLAGGTHRVLKPPDTGWVWSHGGIRRCLAVDPADDLRP